MTTQATDWLESALCAQVDPELFYPTPGGPEIRPARQICNDCPVRLDCINWAIGQRERRGIWGGYSGSQLGHLVRLGETLDALPPYVDQRQHNGRRRTPLPRSNQHRAPNNLTARKHSP
jgi:WhiB family redox-sensing transcriptional regulator